MANAALAQHCLGDLLTEEESAAQIDAHDQFIGLWRDLQHIAAHRCADPGVGDEQIEPTEFLQYCGDQAAVGLDSCHIVLDETRSYAGCREELECFSSRLILNDVSENDVVAGLRKGEPDSAADTAARACDQGNRTRHLILP